MQSSYYSAPIPQFLGSVDDAILGELTRRHHHALEHEQRGAWLSQIAILKAQLDVNSAGHLFLEFSIPRMGKRADAVVIRNGIIFVIEFKVGSESFDRHAIDQVEDYALDLKNFHLGSHDVPILPVLVATRAKRSPSEPLWAADMVAEPVLIGPEGLAPALAALAPTEASAEAIDPIAWQSSGYRPTPTIVEAAEALYRSHAVEEISRSDADAKNLQATSDRIAEVIEASKHGGRKSICFITGVPGAGKTLAGLNIAAKRAERHEDEHAVFLSGNGPLVEVLREALARDQVVRDGIRKGDALRAVRRFVQNIHHFRDHYLANTEVPFEKVVVFDEAQRAWTSNQAARFMQGRGHDGFDISEPEFLIGVMDRHTDWCTIVCLIGGGQEINTGEAGLVEWLTALQSKFPDWDVHASSLLEDKHYTVDQKAAEMLQAPAIQKHPDFHLSVSMRSFRAERLSSFVSIVLDGDAVGARDQLEELEDRYPILLTRDLTEARTWLRGKARGAERIGLVASSGGCRLRPEGIHVKAKIDPANWFLNDRFDVRSSYHLEEVATQFDIQGLELDWAGVCWDADLRRVDSAWSYNAFKGTRWQQVRDETKQLYLLNAYRVLLTRARQGMVIFVPRGGPADATRPPSFYDETFAFLQECGLPTVA
ncbi:MULTISPECIES: DUF2075 domain-containing protein [Halocynthiibacter]|uniref:DUF2075 domain-containing protein n=1 Tax=Halocynthiibacter halioticoli TaxID=2986804 RepID=A0AAE3LSD1_9RHOB|nr:MULTISPECIES: DUF2075 domain-containing protein [Halocynthiibacter]MCV6825673.1 DUF2075 domain-containing protein [Halocynthiibacter halioticoli]MCW4058674.1 DUF2075 domain-containing protein [Halocynthiibacter sp. SDUM655004]